MAKHYILFPNYSQGLKLEVLLKQNNIKYVISPTPRKLSTSCGISIMYNKKDEEVIKDIIDKNSVEIKGLFTIE
ncbi:uncharacterized protein DUF3343 [Keratinibaculum paraultunense]|uniref:Uncharacterized protein DUF3343 n=1 Tax=Keratinibaculum paraultunense TaxID=1278232 RepID=A0A4R3KVH6_9FIRM|nr:DUF3343 domain-containing protein [Keratinibaculum paraultunense]QQY79277.1 DUF3343 domain-containing protein [Keratinibaculum paraultunense]TCS89409.1 uncharacterized protein DUF3343 [Keratinibaculum paraultunense]